MTISDHITQARHDRSARRAVRNERDALVRELAAYSTPAERMEIELIAAHTPGPDAARVMDILNRLAITDGRVSMRRAV